jgi:hypothetical protein
MSFVFFYKTREQVGGRDPAWGVRDGTSGRTRRWGKDIER